MTNWLKLTVGPPVGAAVIRGLAASIRMERRGAEVMDDYYRRGKSMIFAFWHSRQLMMPPGTIVRVLQTRTSIWPNRRRVARINESTSRGLLISTTRVMTARPWDRMSRAT